MIIKSNTLKQKIMRTLKFLFLLFVCATLSFCEKDKSIDCTTCESNDFVMSKVSILGKLFNLKNFTDKKSSDVFMYQSVGNFDEFSSVLKILDSDAATMLNIDDLLGLIVYTNDKEVNKNHDYNIDKNDIEGILLYYKDHNTKNMIVKLFRNKNGFFTPHDISNSKTNNITSNDISDIASLMSDNKSKTSIAFINFLDLPSSNYVINDLQRNINKHKAIKSKLNKEIKSENSGCRVSPCYTNSNGNCTASGNSWTCSKPCGKNQLQVYTESNSNYNYNHTLIDADLYSFRNNYLAVNSGGQSITNMYYKLSSTLEYQNLTLEYCIKTMDIITEVVLPLAKELETNPNSTTHILINNTNRNKLINHLILTKNIYTNSDSKNDIDTLITKINLITNKSNFYITKNLQL